MKWLGQSKALISEVVQVVCATRRVSVADMKCNSRKQAVAKPRQEAMALARELTGQSYPAIGYQFGDRDHTTILYAFRKIRALEAKDPAYAAEMNAMRDAVYALASERIARQGTSTEWFPPPSLASLRPTSLTAHLELVAA